MLERVAGLTGSVAVKPPCVVATTAPIVLNGLQNVNGIDLAEGDRVLVKDQTSYAENGIWIASAGAWYRAYDANAARDLVEGTLVFVTDGVVDASAMYRLVANNPVTPGSTPMGFIKIDPAAGDVYATAAAASALEAQGYATAADLSKTSAAGSAAAAAASAASIQYSSAGDYVGNTSGKLLSAPVIWADAAPRTINMADLTLSNGYRLWTPNLSTGINFEMTLDANLTLQLVSNAKPGQSGYFKIKQTPAGTAVISYGAGYYFQQNAVKTLSVGSQYTDVIFYTVHASNFIMLNMMRAIQAA